MMLMEPISYPVPSQGATTLMGEPRTAMVTASCMNVMPTVLSPRAAALMGAEPDFVYWFTLRWSFFKYSNASGSPKSWISVASIVYDVPDELGSATCSSPLYSGRTRSSQRRGPGSFFVAQRSVLCPQPTAPAYM